jgi:hypothetical protein
MTGQPNEEVEGTTLCVYAYMAQLGKPVGIREVMRGANLCSPSVAHRQLQKLEFMGLLERNEFGNYVIKEKASVSGHVWMGRNLVPRLLFYSFFFLGALGAEFLLITVNIFILRSPLETSFIYLTGMTAVAGALFLAEGTLLLGKLKKNSANPAKVALPKEVENAS